MRESITKEYIICDVCGHRGEYVDTGVWKEIIYNGVVCAEICSRCGDEFALFLSIFKIVMNLDITYRKMRGEMEER